MTTMKNSHVDSLIYQSMMGAYSLSTDSKTSNVISGIHTVLSHFGMTEVWDNLGGTNIGQISSNVKKLSNMIL